MTTMPPPHTSARGFSHLNDASSRLGNDLRLSWQHTLANLTSPRGAQTATQATACKTDPTVPALEPARLHALAMGELGQRLMAVKVGSGWNLQADGVNLLANPLIPPNAAELAQAVANMPPPPKAADLPGLLGQRDWISIYFAQDLGWVPAQHGLVLDLLDVAVNVAMVPTFGIKLGAAVARPWEVSGTRKRLFDPPWHPSWPSGHGVAAFLCSDLLKALTGADAAMQLRLDELAQWIAENRERGQVHTALDTAAGRQVGQAVAGWLVRLATTNCTDGSPWTSLFEAARKTL